MAITRHFSRTFMKEGLLDYDFNTPTVLHIT